MIFINAIGSLPLRTRRVWEASRKIGRMHQNILIFFKGNNIKEALENLQKDE